MSSKRHHLLNTNLPRNFPFVGILTACFFIFSCSHSPTSIEPNTEVEAPEPDINTVANSLSRSQIRIEELDAKISSLSDKVDMLKTAVDNLIGNNQIQTQEIGAKPTIVKTPKSSSVNTLPTKERPSVFKRNEKAIAAFSDAISLFKSGKYSDAEIAFVRFIEKFPNHILAGSAQFFAGESYFLLGEYNLALTEYMKIQTAYPSSPRVPSALVRIAHCYENLGNEVEAKKNWTIAQENFSGNPSLDWPNVAATNVKHKENE